MNPFIAANKKFVSVLAFLWLVTGCGTTPSMPDPIPDDPYYAPMIPAVNAEKVISNGSLYDAMVSNNLYSDRKAMRVGDIITVELRESTQASKSAKTESKKDTDIGVDPIVGLGGRNVNIGGQSIQLGVTSNNSFKGDAKSDQSNSLSGNITVNVMQVLPNGNLVIRGEKWLTLNTGQEFIRLEGVIRAGDVAADNTVESNRIANARIQYSGKGDLQNAQRAGWLSRFFLSLWNPF